MEAASNRRVAEPLWRFYLHALAFLLPGLTVWAFAGLYLYPKVQVIWREGGATGSRVQWLMDVVGLMFEYGWLAVAAVVVALVVAELRPAAWETRRPVIAGLAVWLLNAAIVFGIGSLCILAVFAAPGLMHA